MDRAKPPRALAALCVLLGLSSAASADPVRVVEGYIQVSPASTDFVFRTAAYVGYAGEIEGHVVVPPIVSGMSGDIVTLSATLSEPLTGFSVFAPDRVDFFAAGSATRRNSS